MLLILLRQGKVITDNPREWLSSGGRPQGVYRLVELGCSGGRLVYLAHRMVALNGGREDALQLLPGGKEESPPLTAMERTAIANYVTATFGRGTLSHAPSEIRDMLRTQPRKSIVRNIKLPGSLLRQHPGVSTAQAIRIGMTLLGAEDRKHIVIAPDDLIRRSVRIPEPIYREAHDYARRWKTSVANILRIAFIKYICRHIDKM